MAENNSIQIDLELTTKAFEAAIASATKSAEAFASGVGKGLADLDKQFESLGKAGKDAGDDVAKGGKEASSAWETFKGVLGAEAVVGAFEFMKEAAHALFDTFIVEGVKGAEDAEASLVKLKDALRISGDTANGTLDDFQAFASQLQKTTAADGDAVLAQLALAKQYGLTNDQAKQVVQTATDMAARGYDADESVRKLAESFSGQAGKLAKLNPALRELTEAQLKAGAAAELLGAQFDGAAKTQVETFQGTLARTKNQFGDLQEEIGFLIIRNPALIDALKQAGDLFVQLTAYIADNGDTIKDLITNGVVALVDGFKTAVVAGQAFIAFIQDNATILQAVAVGLGAAAAAFAIYTVAVNAGAIAMGVAAAAQAALNFALTANPIGVVIVALGALAAGVYYVSQNFDQVVTSMAGFAAFALQSMLPAIENILAALAALASVFSDDLATKIAGATETIQQSIDDLTQIQADGEQVLADNAQAARDKEKAAQDTAAANKLSAQQKAQADELATQNSGDAEKLQAKTAALLAQASAQKAADAKAKQDQEARDAEYKAKQAKFEQELEAERRQARATVLKNEADWQKARDDADDLAARNRIQAETSLTESINNEIQSRNSFALASDKERVSNLNSTLGQIASLQNSSSAELFEVGKAAAVAQATISTYQAATVALASAPPPFGFALAAAVTAAGLLNVSKIVNQSRPHASAGSFADGGIVPGSSFTGDKLTANVNSGEAILTTGQQRRLLDLADGQGRAADTATTDALGQRIDALAAAIMAQPVYVQIDGETVALAVRGQVRGGFDLGVT